MKKLATIAILGTILAFFGPKVGLCDQVAATKFKGLNNNQNSVLLDPSEAQDLLNIDVSPGGASFAKRDGFGVYKALGTSKAVHGGFHAFDSTGNDYQLWGSSTSLYGIVADGTPIQLISSATLNSTWDCADSQGLSYCVDSNRDAYIKTNGTTQTWNITPLGTMVESTPDRIIVAGVSGTPNTLYVSQSNTFTNFTVGVNSTDAFTEVIASPGSKLTHIRWGCGKLLWWKDQSFGWFDFDNQYAAQVKTVSNSIGTFDNTSAIDPGGQVWFRGQDGHTYRYDCSILTKESIDITPNIQASGKRVSNSWTQTTQSDWQAGVSTPAINFSFNVSVGDVSLSSFTATDSVNADFILGSGTNVSINASSVQISTNNTGSINDPDFEGTYATNYVGSGPVFDTSEAASACTLNPQSGSQFLRMSAGNGADSTCNLVYGVKILDQSGSVIDTKSSTGANNNCGWTNQILTSTPNVGKRVKFAFFESGDNCIGSPFVHVSTTVASYIFGGSVSYYYSCNLHTPGGSKLWCSFDNVTGGSSTIATGSFTSRTFDTSISSTVVLGQANWTVSTSTPYFEVQSASNSTTGPWKAIATSSNTNATNGLQYVRYISSFTIGATENALTTLDDVTVVVKSTGGTFASQVKNAPNLNAWSTFGANTQATGGTETFYMRSSTFGFTTSSATPVWTAQSVGALVSVATGTFFQVRDDFVATSATSPLALNDFTTNWFEGSATDQAYMLYFDNAIWESVAFGAGQAANNYIFKYDLINQGWTLYNFGAGGLLVEANTLYFGDTSTTGANVFNFGTSTSDNGTAIQSFWRSKSYAGADPFLQTALTNIDIFAKKDTGTTLTATYTIDTSSATAYSVNLSTSNLIVQSRKLLPSGKQGYVWDFKLGDTSASSAWEVLGYRIGFNQLPYRPTQ